MVGASRRDAWDPDSVERLESSTALLTIVEIKVMSRYEARNTIGLVLSSMLVISCDDVERLSSENVKSNSSRNRTVSVGLPICIKDIPSCLMVRAMIPFSKRQIT